MSLTEMSNQDAPVVLITGASGRLGAAMAEGLHPAYRVIIHYRSAESAAVQLCDRLNEKRPESAAIVRADFNEFEQIELCVLEAVNIWQRLDVIVNNASTFFPTHIGETSMTEWQDLFTSNVTAPYFLVQKALPYLQAACGHVINIVDIHGKKPLKGYGVYSIAKAALIMLTKVLARELGPNICVNGIALGVTLWPQYQKMSSIKQQELIDRTVLKHIVRVEDLINAVLFLLNQSSMTGEVITMDSGRLLK